MKKKLCAMKKDKNSKYAGNISENKSKSVSGNNNKNISENKNENISGGNS